MAYKFILWNNSSCHYVEDSSTKKKNLMKSRVTETSRCKKCMLTYIHIIKWKKFSAIFCTTSKWMSDPATESVNYNLLWKSVHSTYINLDICYQRKPVINKWNLFMSEPHFKPCLSFFTQHQHIWSMKWFSLKSIFKLNH